MTKSKPRATAPVQSVVRAATILRSFTETEPELGVTELAQRLELHKSTVSRLLATLKQEGLVSKSKETGRYRLGLGLISLAGVALGQLDVRGVSQPYLNQLVEISQETVNVTVLDGDECVNIERARSPQPIRYVGWIGRRTPLHCTAAGKVLLAFMPEARRTALLSRPPVAYTDATIVDASALEESITQICNQGYAIVHEEFEEGFSGIAAPVVNYSGQVNAAVSISGPSYRLTPEQIETLIEPLIRTTETISSEMGFRGLIRGSRTLAQRE